MGGGQTDTPTDDREVDGWVGTLPFWVVGLGFGVFSIGSSRNLRMEIEPGPHLPIPPHNLGSAPSPWNSPHPPSDPGTSAPSLVALLPLPTAPDPHPPHSEALQFLFLPGLPDGCQGLCLHTIPELGPSLLFQKLSEKKLPRAPPRAEENFLG